MRHILSETTNDQCLCSRFEEAFAPNCRLIVIETPQCVVPKYTLNAEASRATRESSQDVTVLSADVVISLDDLRSTVLISFNLGSNQWLYIFHFVRS